MEGTRVDEWIPLVLAQLNVHFGDKVPKLLQLLKDTKSLISGGFVLAACQPHREGDVVFRTYDMDIYTSADSIQHFISEMVEIEPVFPAQRYRMRTASIYCSSFLRKNGIRKVYTFNRTYQHDKIPSIDIMCVRNKRGPLAVVNNFDLTFCQVWFDGEHVYASHPDHIREKKGYMQKDYCQKLLQGNRFLQARVMKYLRRGFQIIQSPGVNLDETFQSILEKLQYYNECDDVMTGKTQTKEEGQRKFDNPDFQMNWYNRIAMNYFSGKRDATDISGNSILMIPLNIVNFYNRSLENFNISEIDGNDTDDVDETELKRLSVSRYVVKPDEGDVSDTMKYYRTCTNLVINAISRIPPDRMHSKVNLDEMIYDPNDYFSSDHQVEIKKERAIKLLEIIKAKALRTGDDFAYDNGPLYDIHFHAEDKAITKDSMETYLGTTMGGDEHEVRCYNYDANDPQSCQKRLTLDEIRAIVSPDFYKTYTAPRLPKSGLNMEVINFESVFTNIKTFDAAYGNIYHATMCPYCLKFDERGEGCSVMTHANPKRLSNDEAPYCQEDRELRFMIEKYKTLARQLNDGYVRLEFCVECGRPCSGHQHFSLDLTRMVNTPKIPDPANPGQMMFDYGTCPGGGRPEMIARMLAVRDVYRNRTLRDVNEERAAAARAAEAAPMNSTLMGMARMLWAEAQPRIDWETRRRAAVEAARAKSRGDGETAVQQTEAGVAAAAAFAAENPVPPAVDWFTPVPKTKRYDDPTYEREGVENDPDYDLWINEAPGLVPAPVPVVARVPGPMPPLIDPPPPLLQPEPGIAAPVAAPIAPPIAAPIDLPPEVPANLSQRNWNMNTILRLNDYFPSDNVPVAYRQPLMDYFDHIYSGEEAIPPDDQPAQIHLGLIRILSTLLIVEEEYIETWDELITRAVRLGGQRVFNGIGYFRGDEDEDYRENIDNIKRNVLEGLEPGGPVVAPVADNRAAAIAAAAAAMDLPAGLPEPPQQQGGKKRMTRRKRLSQKQR